MLDRRVVSQDEMAKWPADRARSGEKRWAESTWGTGPTEGPRRLFYNWNTWPCRIVFEVNGATSGGGGGGVAHGEAEWRRSKLSLRMKGLKLVSARTGTEIKDARVTRFDQAAVGVEFNPVDGPGIYHLYFGAFEEACFAPSADWLRVADGAAATGGHTRDSTGGAAGDASHTMTAQALCIEARCAADEFDAMEIVALPDEVAALRARLGDRPYVLYPEDRDRPIKLQFELPASWAQDGPRDELVLNADRHEYRVFQVGIWAAKSDTTITAGDVTASDLVNAEGKKISGGALFDPAIPDSIALHHAPQRAHESAQGSGAIAVVRH